MRNHSTDPRDSRIHILSATLLRTARIVRSPVYNNSPHSCRFISTIVSPNHTALATSALIQRACRGNNGILASFVDHPTFSSTYSHHLRLHCANMMHVHHLCILWNILMCFLISLHIDSNKFGNQRNNNAILNTVVFQRGGFAGREQPLNSLACTEKCHQQFLPQC